MTYKIEKKDKKIKILGENFVIRNKYKCHLIYRNKKIALQKDISTKETNNNEIKLKIIGLNAISDMSNLFHGCSSLLHFEKISTTLKYYKYLKESELEQDMIQEDGLFNYNDMNSDNSDNSEENKFNTNMNTQNDNLKQIDSGEKITLTMTKISENMSFLFSDIDEAICQLNDNVLEKTINNSSTIVNMSNMFFQCLSLKSIPDISKINTENVIDISNMFY